MKRVFTARSIFATVSTGLFLTSQAIFYIVIISWVILSFLDLTETGLLIFEVVVAMFIMVIAGKIFHFAYRAETGPQNR